MHIIVFIIKRLVMALCMLYAFDVIVSSAGVIVPSVVGTSCNIWTCCFASTYVGVVI